MFGEAGTYVIDTGESKTTIVADSLDYNGPDGALQALKDGVVIATFRWWTSVVRKDD